MEPNCHARVSLHMTKFYVYGFYVAKGQVSNQGVIPALAVDPTTAVQQVGELHPKANVMFAITADELRQMADELDKHTPETIRMLQDETSRQNSMAAKP